MIYLDNAATSYPKPKEVVRAAYDALLRFGGNPGRGAHALSMNTLDAVYGVREKIAEFFGFAAPERVVFTKNATEALNIAVFGLIPPHSHVLISDLEHNATFRPIHHLSETEGVAFDTFCTGATNLFLEIESKIKKETRAVVSTLVSNVTGRSVDAHVLSKVAKKHGLVLIFDASQAAGHLPIDLSQTPADVLCAPGHKGLCGMMGAGFALFRDAVPCLPRTFGGSGGQSASPAMPEELPDRLEAGTLPVPAILSIGAGILYLVRRGICETQRQTSRLLSTLRCGLEEIPEICVKGADCGILSFTVEGIAPEAFARKLDEYGIAVRAGLHCAPLAHKTLGTFPTGTVRMSLSPLTKEREIVETVAAVRKIVKNERNAAR